MCAFRYLKALGTLGFSSDCVRNYDMLYHWIALYSPCWSCRVSPFWIRLHHSTINVQIALELTPFETRRRRALKVLGVSLTSISRHGGNWSWVLLSSLRCFFVFKAVALAGWTRTVLTCLTFALSAGAPWRHPSTSALYSGAFQGNIFSHWISVYVILELR